MRSSVSQRTLKSPAKSSRDPDLVELVRRPWVGGLFSLTLGPRKSPLTSEVGLV